jgi:hypothetical protein
VFREMRRVREERREDEDNDDEDDVDSSSVCEYKCRRRGCKVQGFKARACKNGGQTRRPCTSPLPMCFCIECVLLLLLCDRALNAHHPVTPVTLMGKARNGTFASLSSGFVFHWSAEVALLSRRTRPRAEHGFIAEWRLRLRRGGEEGKGLRLATMYKGEQKLENKVVHAHRCRHYSAVFIHGETKVGQYHAGQPHETTSRDACKSTTGHIIMLAGEAIAWRSRLQKHTATSTGEQKYRQRTSVARKQRRSPTSWGRWGLRV